MASLLLSRRQLILSGAVSCVVQPAFADTNRRQLPTTLVPESWRKEPVKPQAQKKVVRAAEKPAAPAVSDSQRTSKQDVRYLDVISRYDGKRHKVPYFVNGQYIDDVNGVKSEVNLALCDWRTGQTHDIKRGFLDFQWRLHEVLGTDEPFFILSGYRSRSTNAMLRAKSKNVARNSLHMRGQASDIRLKSRSVRQISRAAQSLRKGGVGKYSDSNFTHIDCGPVRTWGA